LDGPLLADANGFAGVDTPKVNGDDARGSGAGAVVLLLNAKGAAVDDGCAVPPPNTKGLPPVEPAVDGRGGSGAEENGFAA